MDAEPFRFGGEVAVVTGAGQGMGRAHATLLAQLGATVVLNDIQTPHEAIREIEEKGGSASMFVADIGTIEGAQSIIDETLARYGRLDILVNNAGIMPLTPVGALAPEVFDRTMKVNAYGPYYLIRAAWTPLMRALHGRIVNVSSAAALTGLPDRVHYAASKAALIGMTRALAAEARGSGLRVNALVPSAITPMSTGPVRAKLAAEIGLSADTDSETLMRASAGLVAPVVAWLSHPECTLNGEIVEARSGRVSRVLIGANEGFTSAALVPGEITSNLGALLSASVASLYPPIRP